jgi:L-aminopeptidase/D-esterase-like protein
VLCYGCLSRESKVNVIVGFCGFPRFFNEVPEVPGMQLGVHTLRRNQIAPMSKNADFGCTLLMPSRTTYCNHLIRRGNEAV